MVRMLDLASPCLALVPLLTQGGLRKRRAILRAVRRQPGIGVTDLAARVGLGSGSFYAHLRALVAEGQVVVRRHGKFRLVFPAAGAPRRAAPPARLGAKARAIAAFLAANPGLDMDAVLERLPVGRRTAYYHVARFVREGLFTTAEPGRYVALRPTAKVLAMLREREACDAD